MGKRNMKKTGLIIAIVTLFVLVFLFFDQIAQKALSSDDNTREYVQPGKENDTNFATGSQIYQQKCIACHQVTGMGISGTFPPLKGSDFLKNSSKKRIIEQVMNGSGGELVVNGTKYTTSMPPQVDNTTDAVAVTNYILNSWGNHYGIATLQDATGVKKSNKNERHMMMHGRMRGMSGCNTMGRMK